MKWGIADNPELGDKVKITLLASGFDVTIREKEEEGPIVFSGKEEARKKEEKKEEEDRRIFDLYGADTIIQQRQDSARNKYTVLEPGQFDDHEVITLLERTPAFNRDPKFNESLKRISQPDLRQEEPRKPIMPDQGDDKKIVF